MFCNQHVYFPKISVTSDTKSLISLRLGFRRNFCLYLHPNTDKKFFGILISTRLPKTMIYGCMVIKMIFNFLPLRNYHSVTMVTCTSSTSATFKGIIEYLKWQWISYFLRIYFSFLYHCQDFYRTWLYISNMAGVLYKNRNCSPFASTWVHPHGFWWRPSI